MTAAAIDTPDQHHGTAAGAALVLLSAAGFGAMAIFGKLAFEAGISTTTLLLVRFALGTAVFAGILAWRGERIPRAGLAVGLGLGAVGYATQAGLYFGALRELDASLLALVLYTYPAWVTLAAFALGRERLDARRLLALLLSSTGLVIVLAGAAAGSFDALGTALGLAAALAYTAYILVADATGVARAPFALSTLVCAGATVTFAVVGVVTGELDFGFEPEGWLWLACIATVSTALPIAAFFAGLARVGPSAASILSTLEPVVTVGLAAAAFGESLTPLQLLGGALVLSAVVVMQWPARGRLRVAVA